jgi:hypothetical protein
MKTTTFQNWMKICLATILVALPAAPVSGATLAELETSQSMMSDLNSQSVGPGGRYYQTLDEARELSGQGGDVDLSMPLGTVDVTSIVPTGGDDEEKMSVVTGERVKDAITNQLLDDAYVKQVPLSERANYYDDGTHGDLIPNDGQFTNVTMREDVIGQSNQRIKERLIKALMVAESYDPLEFFRLTLASTEERNNLPRNRSWMLVPDPKGGPGYVLQERPVEKPVEVPNYRKKLMARDSRIKNDWAFRFLQEYRKNKDSLTSEFYPMYIPQPPQPPMVEPPAPNDWMPFSDPEALQRSLAEQARSRPDYGGYGGGMEYEGIR